jgi:hypothetical protein
VDPDALDQRLQVALAFSPSRVHPHWCVKAKITVPGDPNSDNKMVLSNFGHVVVPDPDTIGELNVDLLLRYPDLARVREIMVVPRGSRFTLKPGELRGLPDIEGSSGPPPSCDTGPSVVRGLPNRAAFLELGLVADTKLTPWDSQDRDARPRGGVAYPVDPSTLPPGVPPDELVTVAYRVDEDVVGGVTYRIVVPPGPQ